MILFYVKKSPLVAVSMHYRKEKQIVRAIGIIDMSEGDGGTRWWQRAWWERQADFRYVLIPSNRICWWTECRKKGSGKLRLIPHFLAARLSISSAIHWGGEVHHGKGGDRFQRDKRLPFLYRGLDEHIKSALQLYEVGTIANFTLNRMLLTECFCPLKIHVET